VDDWEQDDVCVFLESFGMENEMMLLFSHDFNTGFILNGMEREDAKDIEMSMAMFIAMKRWMKELDMVVKELVKQVCFLFF